MDYLVGGGIVCVLWFLHHMYYSEKRNQREGELHKKINFYYTELKKKKAKETPQKPPVPVRPNK